MAPEKGPPGFRTLRSPCFLSPHGLLGSPCCLEPSACLGPCLGIQLPRTRRCPDPAEEMHLWREVALAPHPGCQEICPGDSLCGCIWKPHPTLNSHHPTICILIVHVLKFIFFFFFFFLGPPPWHTEVPRLEVGPERQVPARTTATTTQNPSNVCNLHPRQCKIPNPLRWARDGNCVLMDASQVHYH